MNNVLHLVVSLFVAACLIWRFQALRADRSAVQISIIGYFIWILVVWAVSIPVVWTAITSATGVDNFAGLASHGGVIVGIACQQVMLVHLANPENRSRARRLATPRIVALGAVLLVMIVLFFANTLGRDYPAGFAVAMGHSVPAYMIIFQLAYLLGQLDVLRLSWRLVRHAPTAWYRRGLYLVLVSAVLMGIYIAGRLADVVAGFFGTTGAAWEPIVLIAVGIGSILQVIGWVLPDAGVMVAHLWAPLSRRRAMRELAPLHQEIVVAHFPELVLDLAQDAPLRDQLYRMVVENRDAQWELRGWMNPEIAERVREAAVAAGRSADEIRAEVEAASLHSAITAKAAGVSFNAAVDQPSQGEPGNMAAEVAHLRRVARAFFREQASAPAPSAVA